MKKLGALLLIGVIACTFTSFNVVGQSGQLLPDGPVFRARVSFSDMVEHDRLFPDLRPAGRRVENNFERLPQFPVDQDKVVHHAPRIELKEQRKVEDPSPLPEVDFQGLDDNGNSIPPDVNGAAGPDHLMVTLNTQIRIMDKSGAPISTIVTESFWQGIPGAGSVFDPKIYYDPYENRWIFVMCSSSDPNVSRVMVAVSETSDPTGNWYLYSFDADPDNLLWFDYPNFGFNKKWVVVAGNMVASVPQHGVLFVINKADLYNYSFDVDYSRIEILDATCLVPAVTLDEAEENVYLVNHAGGNVEGYGYLQLRKVTGDEYEPEIEEIGYSGIPFPWEEWNYFTMGDFAPQLGTDDKLNTIDARYENMVFRNNKLWCVHHVYLPAEEPTRSAVQWWELDPEGTILQWGRVDGEDDGMVYAFATIAVNAKEDILIGYGSFSEEQYASASYSFRTAEDPLNTLRERYQFKDGLAPYYKTFGGNRNRWGDYTATCVDPVNDLDFWTLQEYAELPSGQDEWGVWWAKVNAEAMPEAHFSANITSVPVGSGVYFFDNSKYEPTEWKWILEGGNPSESSEQNPENVIYETAGLFDVTLIVSNAHGSDTLVIEEFIDANTTILPEVMFSANDTLPCVGEVVAFEDLTIYNPTGWLWEFTPGDITFVNGTNAASQNPEVVFSSAAVYEVKLTATNNNGSAYLVKADFVKSGGQTLPFVEDFEGWSFAERSWSIENPDEGKTWQITPVQGNDPGGLAAFVNIKNYNGLNQRDRLISPPLNFSYHSDVTMSLEYAYSQRFPQFSDSLIIYVSADCGETWEKIQQLGEDGSGSFATAGPMLEEFSPTGPEDWCGSPGNPDCLELDLSAWAGLSNVHVMFETVNRYGNNLFIDNILINGTLVGIPAVASEAGRLEVYPNPTDGLLQVMPVTGNTTLSIAVYDIGGRAIIFREYQGQPRGHVSLDLTPFTKGVYFVEVRSGTYTRVAKVVKK